MSRSKAALAELKRQEVQAEIELTERLLAQAAEQGDDEVSRQLVEYKARKEHGLGLWMQQAAYKARLEYETDL